MAGVDYSNQEFEDYPFEIMSIQTIDGADVSADCCQSAVELAVSAAPAPAAARVGQECCLHQNDTFTSPVDELRAICDDSLLRSCPNYIPSQNVANTTHSACLMDGTATKPFSSDTKPDPNKQFVSSYSDRSPDANNHDYLETSDNSKPLEDVDLRVNIRLKRKIPIKSSIDKKNLIEAVPIEKTCLPIIFKMFPFLSNKYVGSVSVFTKQLTFFIILIFSIIALVLLHNSSLRTRKSPNPSKFFISNNPFIVEFEYGQLNDLWSRISQNEVSFIIYYAPWDSDCIRARNEIEVVANHYGQQIFFGAINCWWPDGECRKVQNIRRFPYLVANIRTEGEVEYSGPILASYMIPFLENVINPVIPIQNEGELLDLRAKYDAVLLGYFDFNKSPLQPGYKTFLATAIKALKTDPWRSVAYTVITNSRTATKLKIDADKDSSLVLYVGNSSEHFTAKSSKPAAIISWVYSRAEHYSTVQWINPSGIKSLKMSDFIQKKPTLILFTPRSFILGISPYFDLLREIVLDYFNCDNSPIIRSLVHRNILRRRLLEDKFSELEERCHEILDDEEINKNEFRKFRDNEDTCCHSQTVKWRSFGGVRRGITKKCLCTSCVHISLPKCPSHCNHFDCLSTAARFLDDFDPNFVNNSAVYCNQIKTLYEPKYTSYYKISTTCSGIVSPTIDMEDNSQWNDVNKYSVLSSDDKINQMIRDFEIQHCRRLKLGMNYTDLNFPDSSEIRKLSWRANFTGLACRTNRTLKFMALDSSLYPSFAESLGIDVFNVPHSTVAVIMDPNKESFHLLEHEILFEEVEMPNFEHKSIVNVPVNSYSKKTLIEFIKNYTDGTLPRYLRNKLVSSSGLCDLKQMVLNKTAQDNAVICVPELNSITFTNFIMGKSFVDNQNKDNLKVLAEFSNKDILVMYYAPWCGFCTSIAHVYLDVARFFTFSSDIVFTRINGDANDLPWEYTVDRYPTIMFFPARRRSSSIVYPSNKAITKAGLFKFIIDHSQLSVRMQTMLIFCKQTCIKQTLLQNHKYRRTISRSILHNLNSLTLFQYQLEQVNRKIQTANSKESNKLAKKNRLLIDHTKYIQLTLRKLRRIQHRQILLSHFLLLRIEQFRMLYHNQELTAYQSKLSDELYNLLFPNAKPKKSGNKSATSKNINIDNSDNQSNQSFNKQSKTSNVQSKTKKGVKKAKDEL